MSARATRAGLGLLALLAVLGGGGCTSAVSSVLRAVDDDKDLITINREAQLAYESGEAARAEALYKSIARRAPNDSEAWLRLGNLYARNNRADEAAQAYQRALLANSGDARAWHNLGVVRLRQAWASLLQAQATTPGDDPLAASTEATLEYLGKMPLLEDAPRKAPADHDATKY